MVRSALTIYPYSLDAKGLKSEIKKSRSLDEISGVAIVGVDRKKSGYFHWVIAIKDNERFLIIDPKEGEVLNGKKCIRRKRYKHGPGTSTYLSVGKSVESIII